MTSIRGEARPALPCLLFFRSLPHQLDDRAGIPPHVRSKAQLYPRALARPLELDPSSSSSRPPVIYNYD